MAQQSLSTPWVTTQHRTFTRWCNIFLTKHPTDPIELKGIVDPPELSSGYNLLLLLELLTKKPSFKNDSVKNASKKATRFQYLDNMNRVLAIIKEAGIFLVNIGGPDIVDANLKITLGLVWALILKFQIEGRSGVATGNGDDAKSKIKQALIDWVNSKITPLGVGPIRNLGRDWNNGLALCALNESLDPEAQDLEMCKQMATTPDGRLANGRLAIKVAVERLGIPRLVEAEDFICPEPDELSMMTLVSVYRENELAILHRRQQEDNARSLFMDQERMRREEEQRRRDEEDRKRKEHEEWARNEADRMRAEALSHMQGEQRRLAEEERLRMQQQQLEAQRMQREREEAERRRRQSQQEQLYRDSKWLLAIMGSAKGVRGADLTGYSDPYVVAKIGETSQKTSTIKKNVNPVWNEALAIKLPAQWWKKSLQLSVFDKDMFSKDDLLGLYDFDLEQLGCNGLEEKKTYTVGLVGPGATGTITFALALYGTEPNVKKMKKDGLGSLFSVSVKF